MKNVKVELTGTDPTVLTVRESVQPGWERWVLLRSDAHHDNVFSDHELEVKHLELAKERNAIIVDAGDLCCAMQGKWDPRKDWPQMRPELAGNYLDRLVDYNSEYLDPYAENLLVLARGNHETSITRRHETDLTERITESIRVRTGHRVFPGTYQGWVFFKFRLGSTSHQSLRLWWHHGWGGGGPVTRGTIQPNRISVWNSNANVCVTGHTHDQWLFPIEQMGLDGRGHQRRWTQWHVRPGTYKDNRTGGGWERERGHPPKRLGAVWMRLFWDTGRSSSGRVKNVVSFEFTPTA